MGNYFGQPTPLPPIHTQQPWWWEHNNQEQQQTLQEEEEEHILHATKLLQRDKATIQSLCSQLKHQKFAIIRLTKEQETQLLTTRQKVEQFFNQSIDYKLQYVVPSSSDPLLPLKKNRGYISQQHKEYLKIRLIDEASYHYPGEIEGLEMNFKRANEMLRDVCEAALYALSGFTSFDLLFSDDELNDASHIHPSDHQRLLQLSTYNLCKSWIPEGSSLSVIRYYKEGSVVDRDYPEYSPPRDDQKHNNNHHISDDNDDDVNNKNNNNNNDKNNNDNHDGDDELRNVCGAHYDTGIFTLIRISEVPGLQVYDDNMKKWIAIEEIGRVGDMVLIMGRKMTDMIPSIPNVLFPTFHRVVVPKGQLRHSILFFCDLPAGKDD